MTRSPQQRSEYNKRYYIANKKKILAQMESHRISSKIECPICGELMGSRSKMCNRCTITKRNQSKEQRTAVGTYWSGRSRNEWLDKWRNYEMTQLTYDEVRALDDNWIRLLGWILTDGSIRKHWGIVVIYQTKERGKQLIRQILKELEIPFKEYEYSTRPEEVTFYIPAEHSRTVLDTLRMSAPKCLPKWSEYMNDVQAKVLISSLLDGDGTRTKYSTALYGLKNMLDDIYVFMMSHKISCSLNYNQGECYYIQIHQNQGM